MGGARNVRCVEADMCHDSSVIQEEPQLMLMLTRIISLLGFAAGMGLCDSSSSGVVCCLVLSDLVA